MKTTLGQPLVYEGTLLGYVDGKRHFHPTLGALETLDFLEDLDIAIKVRLRTQAPHLYRLAQHHGLQPHDYITPYEAGLWAADHAHDKNDLRRHTPVAWHILHHLGLEDKVFPQLQPA